jgi:diguanylate cyclase (GGDEF)-like protein
MSGAPIRIFWVGEAQEARRLRGLLNKNRSRQFRMLQFPDLKSALAPLSRDEADVLLLDIGSHPAQGRADASAAHAANPSLPLVILSDSEDEPLAVELLRQGAQDFLAKGALDCKGFVRSLRYAIERHQLQRALQNLSLLDDLTGLHNRRGFMALAEQHLRLIRRKGAALLVYLDLDNLKLINDSFGHPEGNRALIETANILRACFRQSDILARLSGDEFCVLMTDACRDTAVQVRKRLQQRLELTNSRSSRRYHLSLSMGIANVPTYGSPRLEELLRVADALMYEQKRKKQERSPEIVTVNQPMSA